MVKPSARILSLDLLRGYFLFVIIVDHLYRFPGLFDFLTGQGRLWVSAAEGFFIISGLMIGMIYKNSIASDLPGTLKKLWSRAAKLYFLSIGLTLLFTVWGHLHLPLMVKSGLWTGNFSNLILSVFTLRYVYGWADFLPYYAVFITFSPLVLWLASRGRTWLVLTGSLLLWLVRGQSFYLAWQLLFMTGLLVGYHFVYLKNLFSRLSLHRQMIIYRLVLFSAIAAISLSSIAVFYFHWKSQFFDKNTLGFGRFLLAWLVFTALFVVFRKNEVFIHRFSHGALALLGRNSLFTYALHAVVIFPNSLFFPLPGTFLLNSLLCLLVLILVYLPLYLLTSVRLQAVSWRTLRQFPSSLKMPK